MLQIIINDNINILKNNFINNLLQVKYREINTRYLGMIMLKNNIAIIKWGWTDDDIKNSDPPYLLHELNKITYDNNLNLLVNSDQTHCVSINIIIACLECIRRYYNKKIYFVKTDTINNINNIMIFI